MSNKKILLLEGGYNEEHEVSIITAKEVKKALNELGYHFQSIIVNPKDFKNKIKYFENFDLCFNALHGTYGEDGRIQKILLDNNLRFTHSGVEASKKSFDKNLTKESIKKTNVSYLVSLEISKKDIIKKNFIDYFDKFGSFVLKPSSSGSSYGVRILKNIKEIDLFFLDIENEKKIYKNHNRFLIEPYINGKELTVAVYEEEGISKSIDVTEIISNNAFYDYNAKYSKGLSSHILPANIPTNIYKRCLINAKIVHDTLDCKGVSRSDFLFDEKKNALYFLEINTQPGLTPLSLVPEQLGYNRISFISFIEKLINII